MPFSAAPSPVGSLLIVDDSLVQRTQLAALCRELGVPLIYEAANGAEALELLSLLVLPPDLMIVDLEMPGMDGIELIQQMCQRELVVPLIVASSREVDLIQAVETMARNQGMPVLTALRKPLQLGQLQRAFEDFARLRARDSGTVPLDALEFPGMEALAEAIEGGGIDVHYQPKVDMLTGELRGVEALARWTPADGRGVRPDVFVAAAERGGLIHDLTRLVMTRALRQAARWNAQGLRLSMAVNLSPRLLDAPGLVNEIAGLAADQGLQPNQVVLELTESSVVESLGSALGVLARLRLRGFGLSIDDYGTGFSSMQQLARIPFTELKIDRSFVHNAHKRTNLRVILQSALQLARQLGMVAVAEGIETPEDWRLVQQSGCNVAQGFHVARPMPGEALPDWVLGHRLRMPALRAPQ